MKPTAQLHHHQGLLMIRSIRGEIRRAQKKPEFATRHVDRAISLTRTLLWHLDPFNHD